MSKKGIWLVQETTDQQIETLREIAPDYELIRGWDTEAIDFPADDIEIMYGWESGKTEKLLESPTSQLKWIQGKSAGVDYFDLDTMQKKKILLTNGSGIHAIPISESIFGMLLAYSRGILFAAKNQPEKKWDRDAKMIELNEKTIMIVGSGQIGEAAGRLAKAFNMRTIGVNRSGREVPYMDVIIKQPDVIEHIHEADIVVNILPLTDATKYFFNEKLFSKMKSDSLFINVGRGPSVDTKSLINALDEGRLSFAGLDVFETEPLEEDSGLWERDDVLITPHFSGMAQHFKKRLFAIFEENLRAYVAGETTLPRNLIDYEHKY